MLETEDCIKLIVSIFIHSIYHITRSLHWNSRWTMYYCI